MKIQDWKNPGIDFTTVTHLSSPFIKTLVWLIWCVNKISTTRFRVIVAHKTPLFFYRSRVYKVKEFCIKNSHKKHPTRPSSLPGMMIRLEFSNKVRFVKSPPGLNYKSKNEKKVIKLIQALSKDWKHKSIQTAV